MKEVELQICNRLGLHARAAAKFVHTANRFECRIGVVRGDSRVDGKSILGLLTLAAAKGSRIRLQADGQDEEDALRELTSLVESRFGEEA